MENRKTILVDGKYSLVEDLTREELIEALGRAEDLLTPKEAEFKPGDILYYLVGNTLYKSEVCRVHRAETTSYYFKSSEEGYSHAYPRNIRVDEELVFETKDAAKAFIEGGNKK